MAVQREIVDKDGNRLTVVQGGAGKAAVYGKTAEGEWVPLQVDAAGRAVLNVGEVSATIGVIEQGAAGQDPWPVQLNGSIVDTEDNVLRVKQYGTKAAFTYTESEYLVRGLSADGKILYGSKNNRVYRSIDTGKTWVQTDIPAMANNHSYIVAVATSGVFLISGNTPYHSTNGINFTPLNTGDIADIRRPLLGGFAVNGDTIIFGEYGTAPGGEPSPYRRIFRSTDGGATWAVVLDCSDLSSPNRIRHFHSVDHFASNRFVATAGDGLDDVKWFTSKNGIDWTLIPATTRQQIYRTLGIVATTVGQNSAGLVDEYGPFGIRQIWATDSDVQSAIYVCEKGEEAYPQQLLNLPGRAYAVEGYHNEVLVGVLGEDGDKGSKLGYIFVTKDGGNTWQIDHTWQVGAESTSGGVHGIIGPDILGRYHLTIADGSARNGWLATPTLQYAGNLKPLPAKRYPQKSYICKVTCAPNASEMLRFGRFNQIIHPATGGFTQFKLNVVPDSTHTYFVKQRLYGQESSAADSSQSDMGIIAEIDYIESASQGNVIGDWTEAAAGGISFRLRNSDTVAHTYTIELLIK